MERLLTVGDIAELMQVSTVTARSYIRGMRHTEKPLRVFESEFAAWVYSKTVSPKKQNVSVTKRLQRSDDGKYHLSRERR